jgi:hypothetical protein
MRRPSLLGPIVLIVIGLLFLLRNFLPELQLFDLLTRYWPYGLIAWGVVRLGEVLLGRRGDDRGVSGGEWVLVVLLCLAGSGLHWGRQQSSWWSNRIAQGTWELFGESYEFPVNGSLEAGKTPRILIDNARGDTRITGSDIEQVRMTGTRSIRALNQEAANRDDRATAVQIVREGDTIVIRSTLDRSGTGPQGRADLEIQVPRGARVETRGRYGDFDLDNVDGDVEISSENAGVRLANLGGNVRIDLLRSDLVRAVGVKGNVEVKGRGDEVELDNIGGTATVNGTFSGDIEFRKIARQLRFESQSTSLQVENVVGTLRLSGGELTGSDVTGPLVLRAKSKDVELNGFTGAVSVEVDRGDVTLRPAGIAFGKVAAMTKAGDVELVLPAAAKFAIAARTRRGEVTNDYGPPLRMANEERGGSLEGSTGDGPRVVLETDRGDIRVRKGEGRPAPAIVEKPLDSPAPPATPLPLQRSVQ